MMANSVTNIRRRVPEVSDQQAQRLWQMAESEPGKKFRTASSAVKSLKRRGPRKR